MSLSWRERRALRGINRLLAQEDPCLAERLHGPATGPAPITVLDRIAWWYFWASTLLGYGLVFDEADLLRSATLLLAVFPPLILVMAAVNRCSPHVQNTIQRPPD